MKILAMDATSERGSIAVTEDDHVIEEIAFESSDRMAEILFPEIEKLLARNGLRMEDFDGFASASGPGTFTGVRIGLTAAKGLAEAMSRKVVAVSNLRAMAWFGTKALRAPMTDARRGEIYGAVYNSSLETVQEEVVMKYDAWVAGLPADAEILSGQRALAGAVGRIATREFSAGRSVDPAEVNANYVRRPDAEMLWKEVV